MQGPFYCCGKTFVAVPELREHQGQHDERADLILVGRRFLAQSGYRNLTDEQVILAALILVDWTDRELIEEMLGDGPVGVPV